MLRSIGATGSGLHHFGPVVNVFPSRPPVDLGSALRSAFHILSTGPVTDLNINIYASTESETPRVDLEGNPTRYRPEAVAAHRGNVLAILDALVHAPATSPLTDLLLEKSAPAHHLGPPAAPERVLPLLVADRRPSSEHGPAVIDGDRRWSRRELDTAIAALAHRLRCLGIGPEDRVIVESGRGVGEVVAFWAVAAVGACHVPVDPRHPERRRAAIIAASRARVGIRAADCEPSSNTLRWLTIDLDAIDPPHDPNPVVSQPSGAAYLIFTSGSTGTPKGVVVTHSGLASFADTVIADYGLTPRSVIARLASPAFDTAVVEMVAAALSTATLAVVPAEVIAGTELAAHLTALAVTHVFITPAVLATMQPADLPTVTHLIVGGDVCPAGLLRTWAAVASVRIAYGPTETTCSVTMTEPVETDRVSSFARGIGTPMCGVGLRVLDRRLRPVLPGVPGELYVTGPCVARGYVDAPAQTSERFVADPFARNGSRMYRTGDRVTWLPDGTFDFLGRTDHQVQIRGVRVEPGEIDAVIGSQPEIDQSVTVVASRDETTVLATYYRCTPHDHLEPGELRSRLIGLLPSTMVPASINRVDAFPLTPSGKVDRAALPAPRFTGTATPRPPSGPDEARVVAAFESVLTGVAGTPRVGADDDIFELGGDSLAATAIASRLSAGSMAPVTVRDVVEARTPAGIAERMQSRGAPGIPSTSSCAGSMAPAPLQRTIDLADRTAAPVIPFRIDVTMAVDDEALGLAARTLRGRHDMLRARFVRDAIVVDPPDSLRDSRFDVLADDGAVLPFIHRGFDIAREHPVRFGVVRTPTTTTIAVAIHHAFADGRSLRILADDIAETFLPASGIAARVPSVDYLDYARSAREQLGSPDDPDSMWSRQIRFWHTETSPPPAEFDPPAPSTPAGGSVVRRDRFEIPTDRWSEIVDTARAQSVSTTTVLRAHLAVRLCTAFRRPEVVIGTPIDRRPATGVESVVGMFVNTVAVRCRVGSRSIRAVVESVAAAEHRAYAHSDVAFVDVAAALGQTPDGAHPLFEVVLSIEQPPTAIVSFSATITPLPPPIAKCLLHFSVTPPVAGHPGQVEVLYATGRFEPTTIAALTTGWIADIGD